MDLIFELQVFLSSLKISLTIGWCLLFVFLVVVFKNAQKYFKLKDSKSISCQHMKDTAKTVFIGNFIICNIFIIKKKDWKFKLNISTQENNTEDPKK